MIKIHDREFKSKNAALIFFQDIMSRNQSGMPIDPHDYFMNENPDYDYLSALVQLHPSDDMKKTGIKSFCVKWKAEPGMKAHHSFYVTYTNNETHNFSYRKCIEGVNEKKELSHHYRMAILPTIESFRKMKTISTCEFPGHTGLNTIGEQVDHVPPKTFDYLLKAFIKEDGKLDPTDLFQIARWKEYHDKNCELRWVCAKCNTSDIKKAVNSLAKNKRYDEFDLYMEQLKNNGK